MDKENESNSSLLFLSEDEKKSVKKPVILSDVERSGFKQYPSTTQAVARARFQMMDFDQPELQEKPKIWKAFPLTLIGIASCLGILGYGTLRKGGRFSDQTMLNISMAAQIATVASLFGHLGYYEYKVRKLADLAENEKNDNADASS
ncbi:hypothetical protein MAR_015259 [Mya arenaria]|uniref:HIG1 domain-containing protein n=1 Tax=Mya arenaria TaxID=6604 RepID=A0ABY7FGV2_MYAAR|nr:hypothetical protein MAR_015259 [Mya arenaria]